VITRMDFLKTAGTGIATLAIPRRSVAARPSGDKPNIIFILADDLGYGDLGCYGQKRIRTPNLDRMADEGIRFTDHYAGNTVCAPSRCALMTGLHMGHAYIRDNGKNNLRPTDVTAAEVLKRAGYATGLVGKWGIGHEGSTGIPTRQGFDYFFGYLDQQHAHNYYPEFLVRNETRVPLKNVVPEPGKYGQGVAAKRVAYSHDLLVRDALDFVERSKDGPFFLYLALTIPHANNEAGSQGMEVPSNAPYGEEDWPEQQKNIAAMITRMDRDIGTLLTRLESLGIDENTLVFFSSDNGPHHEGGNDPDFFTSSGPLRGIKRDLYEGGIRVPMLARWPGTIRPGTVSGHISAFWDFLPTAAELAGTPLDEPVDGISMVPTLLGRSAEQKPHGFLYWEFKGKQAVRMGEWKAVRLARGEPLEIYNLRDDIGEKHNVADRHPDIVAKIETYLQTARTESKLFPLLPK